MHNAAAALQNAANATTMTTHPKTIVMIAAGMSPAFDSMGPPFKNVAITIMAAPTAASFSSNSNRFLNLVAGLKAIEVNRTACQPHMY
jgi:hypothetical protein